jgi:hypothetical protein
MKKTYKLNDEQRQILRMAKRGLISEDLNNAMQAILKGKASNPVHNLRSLHIVDNRYDGKEDRSQVLRFVPDDRLNIFGGLCLEKYGQPFGPILLAYLIFGPGLSRRAADKWRKKFVETHYPYVDLGEERRQPRGKRKPGGPPAAPAKARRPHS